MEAICPCGRISNQAATSSSMNGIPASPHPQCEDGAGLKRVIKKVGSREMSQAGIPSATTAVYGPTTSTSTYIPKRCRSLPEIIQAMSVIQAIQAIQANTSNPGYTGNPGYTSNPGYVSNSVALTQASLPAGAPTPPDPNAERLAMPDYNMYKPITGQAKEGTYYNYPAQKSSALAATYPIQTGYPGFANNPDQQKGYPASGSIPAQSSYPGQVNNQASMGPQLQATNPAIVNGPVICKCSGNDSFH